MVAFLHCLNDQSYSGNDIYRNGVACHFVELTIFQTGGGSFVELLICKPLQAKTLNGHEPADYTDPPDTVSVLCSEGKHGLFLIFNSASLLPDSIPVWSEDSSGAHHQDTRAFTFVLADTGIQLCGEASGILRDLRLYVQVDEYCLSGTARQGVSDFFAHTPSTAVDAGVRDVDTVTGVCHLVARLRQHLHRDLYILRIGGCLEGQFQYTILSFLRTLRHRL